MKLLIAFGTRPEYIKVLSLIKNLSNVKTLFTGQHTDLLKDIKADYIITIDNLGDNRLNNVVCSVLKHSYIFKDITHVLVQGDTTSALAVALSSFHNSKKVIHLEAGLRTFDINDPYPEELNRQLISRIATIHFCPTELNKQNLLNEKVNGDIIVTGNTGLDNISKDNCCYSNIVLLTMHRRDNHHIMDQWFLTFTKLAKKYTDLEFIIPLHPNPAVQKHKNLLQNITIIDPLEHNELINILKKCRFVISDSGGLAHEESSYLNKKSIICRKTTERPEILNKHGILCSDPSQLEEIVHNVYSNYEINEPCPYGDGQAWKKIKYYLDNLIN